MKQLLSASLPQCREAESRIDSDEKTAIGSCNRAVNSSPGYEIFIHFAPKGAMKGYPSCSPFKHLHKQHAGMSVNVFQMKSEGLAEAKAGAIQK